MNEQFVKRLKSFAWRVGALSTVAALNIISANLGMLELPAWVVTLLGLALGEVTKWLNTK